MPEIKFLAQIPDTPTQKTFNFTLKAPIVDERALYQAAQGFGLKGGLDTGSIQQDKVKISYNEGPRVVTLYRASGAMRYQDLTRWQVDDGQSVVQYDDDKAVEIAQRFVERAGLVALQESKLLKVTRLHAGTVEPATGFAEERVIDVGVVFQQVINGVPVDGPGGKAVVYLDYQGEVTGFDRIWREIETVHSPVELYQPSQALKDQILKYWHDWATIEVLDARFGYFQLGFQDSQRYLQPAYIVEVALTASDKRVRTKSVYVVTAAEKAIESLTPPRKRILDQPLREDK